MYEDQYNRFVKRAKEIMLTYCFRHNFSLPVQPLPLIGVKTVHEDQYNRFVKRAKEIMLTYCFRHNPSKQDDILTAAQEAGFKTENWTNCAHISVYANGVEIGDKLERFAALVAEPWIETNKALAKEIIEMQKQAEQRSDSEQMEPVAKPKLIGWRTENFLWETDDIEKAKNWEPHLVVLPIFEGDPYTKLYAAPPRTKDLTDDEVMACRSSDPAGGSWLESARAVIAADREKNNA